MPPDITFSYPFFAALCYNEAIVYTKEVVQDLFKQLDLNGDGKVTSEEFSKKEVDEAVAKVPNSAKQCSCLGK